MSFKNYLKELENKMDLPDFDGETIGYDDIAELIANDHNLLKLMGVEGLTLDDLENDTKKFYNFIISHLRELKKKYNFNANKEDLEVDFYYATKGKK